MDIQIICIGNPFRRDDGAGVECAHILPFLVPYGIKVSTATGEGFDLIDRWKNSDAVILIDAASSDAKPGTIHRFDARKEPIPASYFKSSTHEFCVAEAVEKAREQDQLPEHLILYGIEGADFGEGAELTPIVEDSLEKVLVDVQRDVRLMLDAAGVVEIEEFPLT